MLGPNLGPWQFAEGGPAIASRDSHAFVDDYAPEDEVLEDARRRAEEVGITPVTPGAGAALGLLASLVGARAAVEIGTGTGVSGLWLLRGMRSDGVLTSVDSEAEHSRLARQTFTQAGIPTQRTRLITGRALEVLPRLADGAYDLILCSGDKQDYAAVIEEGVRLLRTGGVLIVDNALWGDRVADPAQRDPVTVAIRQAVASVSNDERLTTALLPVGDGLLVAQRLDS